MLKHHFDENNFNNEIFLRFKIEQAKHIIRRSSEVFGHKLAVAFSGGKDSLVALHLTLQTLGSNIKVIYNHTTVEFPETIKYVKQIAKEWNFELLISKPKKPFLESVKENGWATHENRWCCRPYKEEPAYELMIKEGIEAEITGTYRTESIYRRYLRPIMSPKKNPKITRIHPIFDWNDVEVWMYIRGNNLPYNPLYDMGYKRIGCWCCPLNGPSHYRRLMRTHPYLFNFLLNFEPKHPIASALDVLSNHKNKPKFAIQICHERKNMFHVIFEDKNYGKIITEKLQKIEVHEEGQVVCIPADLRGFLESFTKEIKRLKCFVQ